MFLDVSREEGANRNNSKPALTRRDKRESDQSCAETSALMRRWDLGVGEDDLAFGKRIFSKGEAAVAEIDLEPMPIRIVAHREIGPNVTHPAAALTIIDPIRYMNGATSRKMTVFGALRLLFPSIALLASGVPIGGLQE
jgi:hypothetical protein